MKEIWLYSVINIYRGTNYKVLVVIIRKEKKMSYVLKKRNNPDLQIRFTEDKAFKDLNKSVRNFLNLLVANAFNLDQATVAKAQLIDN